MNLLQNYQQSPSNKNLQHPLPLFPYMPLPPLLMSKNSHNPPHFILYLALPQPPPVIYKQSLSTENFQSSHTFPSMPQNTFNVFRKPPNNCSRTQTPSIEEVDTHFSQFFTQIELENITLELGGGSSTRKKKGTQIYFFN